MTDSAIVEPFQLSINGITYRKIADQIVTALEGGSGYWMKSFKPAADIKTTVSPWYDDENIWAGDFDIEVKVYEERKSYHLTPDKIKTGLQWLADSHMRRIEEIVKESGDAETADVFIQACLFGEIVYG